MIIKHCHMFTSLWMFTCMTSAHENNSTGQRWSPCPTPRSQRTERHGKMAAVCRAHQRRALSASNITLPLPLCSARASFHRKHKTAIVSPSIEFPKYTLTLNKRNEVTLFGGLLSRRGHNFTPMCLSSVLFERFVSNSLAPVGRVLLVSQSVNNQGGDPCYYTQNNTTFSWPALLAPSNAAVFRGIFIIVWGGMYETYFYI